MDKFEKKKKKRNKRGKNICKKNKKILGTIGRTD